MNRSSVWRGISQTDRVSQKLLQHDSLECVTGLVDSQAHIAHLYRDATIVAQSNANVSFFISLLLRRSGQVRLFERRGSRGIKWVAWDALMVNFRSLVRSRIRDMGSGSLLWRLINSTFVSNVKSSCWLPTQLILCYSPICLELKQVNTHHVRPLSFLSVIKWAHIPLIKPKWII